MRRSCASKCLEGVEAETGFVRYVLQRKTLDVPTGNTISVFTIMFEIMSAIADFSINCSPLQMVEGVEGSVASTTIEGEVAM